MLALPLPPVGARLLADDGEVNHGFGSRVGAQNIVAPLARSLVAVVVS